MAVSSIVKWEIKDAILYYGAVDEGYEKGEITGSFEYDAESDAYSSVNIEVSLNGSSDNIIFDSGSKMSEETKTGFIIENLDDRGPKDYSKEKLSLEFERAMTNAGGDIKIKKTSNYCWEESQSDISDFDEESYVTSGNGIISAPSRIKPPTGFTRIR